MAQEIYVVLTTKASGSTVTRSGVGYLDLIQAQGAFKDTVRNAMQNDLSSCYIGATPKAGFSHKVDHTSYEFSDGSTLQPQYAVHLLNVQVVGKGKKPATATTPPASSGSGPVGVTGSAGTPGVPSIIMVSGIPYIKDPTTGSLTPVPYTAAPVSSPAVAGTFPITPVGGTAPVYNPPEEDEDDEEEEEDDE